MARTSSGHTVEHSRPAPEAWQATKPQTPIPTQSAPDESDELTARVDAGKLGRHVGGDQPELFVSCDVAEALRQQLDQLRPVYIALHYLGTASTRTLLAGVAAATQHSLQQLVIRRPGYGAPLATLQFLDLPTGGGATLRLYTTELDADSHTRQGIVRALLAYSRLGVVMVGDMPAHLLKSSLQPLHDAMVAGPWTNRHLLLLPLASSALLAREGQSLGRGSGVQVRTTPQVARPAEAWSFVSGAWNKLREPSKHTSPMSVNSPPGQARPTPSESVPVPAPGRSNTGLKVESTLGRYVRLLADLPGMVSCSVFDVSNGRPLVHAGARPGPEELARHGCAMLAALASSSRALGFGHGMPEAAVTLGTHHLLLRGVPKHPGVALHAVFDKTRADLTTARVQIGRMDALFTGPPG